MSLTYTFELEKLPLFNSNKLIYTSSSQDALSRVLLCDLLHYQLGRAQSLPRSAEPRSKEVLILKFGEKA